MRHKSRVIIALLTAGIIGFSANALAGGTDPYGNEDPNKKVLKQGLLGAGTGAIAAGASDGDAGKGALIGAGTNVIGGALLDALTTPSQPQPQQTYYSAPPPASYSQVPPPQYQQQQTYYPETRQTGYYAPPPPPVQQPQQNQTQNVLKQGLLGAGTGAIASGASGGDAGTGALVGAGTNIIGGALLDALTAPSQPQPQQAYYAPPPAYYQQPVSYSQSQPQKKIIRKYDAEGNVISEEEVYQ